MKLDKAKEAQIILNRLSYINDCIEYLKNQKEGMGSITVHYYEDDSLILRADILGFFENIKKSALEKIENL